MFLYEQYITNHVNDDYNHHHQLIPILPPVFDLTQTGIIEIMQFDIIV